MFGRRALLAALVLLFGVVGAQAGSEGRAHSFSTEGLAKVSDYIRNEIATGRIPGAILLLQQHGKPVYYENFGVRDVATEISMSADTIFRLYSMSKPVTSVLAMMLVEEGKLALDEPVSKYIPAFAGMKVGVEKKAEDDRVSLELEPLNRPVTIEDLMRHTSGIPYGYYGGDLVNKLYADAGLFDNKALNNAELVAKIATLPLAEQPGTIWDYGLSIDVLGRIIEVISGKSLFAFAKERLLDPLGMKDTAFYVADPAKWPRIAEPMPEDRALSPMAKVRDIRKPLRWESGGGGLVGTVGDYARFSQMLLNGGTLDGRRYLKPETIALMASDHVGPATHVERDKNFYPGATSGYGLGFAVRISVPAGTSWPLGEYRWDGVGGTFFFIDPEDDLFGIFMVQTPSQRGRIQLGLKTLIYQAMGR
ncbi:beta-lactamase family protein [Bradyrhizobium sp. WYCCWR 13023]|uniref:Beta-lactamase family protein n=1 Tax=Bradyrhizobium zhengyangense TaxID=2911009 RepID=A0A9X1UBQ7_9BRAD|nr:serine hydrolase domain-containing protein [Bradyrhizobium sp. CCBAU 11434]MCG2629609.1 beta-lactamase family protein [Bradyrhizobium zhengyangense]MCG2643941.1 beta-lactamase family protein [Bradyrhizobium zhengyangense]MCG2671130.1 beta-lactamase family protein [Bradyrhizobium zhengyangense]